MGLRQRLRAFMASGDPDVDPMHIGAGLSVSLHCHYDRLEVTRYDSAYGGLVKIRAGEQEITLFPRRDPLDFNGVDELDAMCEALANPQRRSY